MDWFPLAIFPEGSLAASVTVTVWIGITIVAITNLRLGWVLSGLVIPGYMVPLLIAKPLAAGVVFGEGIVTYALVWLYSEYLTRFTGFSSFFGRDRFFALVIASVGVRIVADGWALPELGEWLQTNYDYAFDYRNNLHSFGLIIVALIANNFWKTGLVRGAFPMFIQVGLTWLVVRYVLMETTNFNISSLAFMYEDSASSFLATPKAYIILLVTAFIASRLNLFYGWDFSGILIPSLLALQWFEPYKILTTFVEAAVILVLADFALRLPIFRNITVEGARKLLLFFNIGFAYKFALAWLLTFFMPEMKATDWFGFGYLLATLLALKMHDKGLFARMTAATLQTSFLGIAVATVVGFLLIVMPDPQWDGTDEIYVNSLPPLPKLSASLEDTLFVEKTGFYAATLGAGNRVFLQKELDAFATGLRRLLEYRKLRNEATLDDARRAMNAAGYEVIEVAGDYLMLQAKPEARQGGSYVIRMEGDSPLLVSVPSPIDEQGSYEAGVRLFDRLDANAFASAGSARRVGEDGSSDVLKWPQSIFQVFHRELAPREVLQVRTNPPGEGTVVHLAGQLPESFDLSTLQPPASALRLEFVPHPEKNLQRQTLSGRFTELWLSPSDAIKTVYFSGDQLTDPRERIQDSFVSLLRDSITASTVAPSGSELFLAPSPEKLLRIDREVLSTLFDLAGAEMSDLAMRQKNFEKFKAVQQTAKSLGLSARWIANAEAEHLLLKDEEGAGGWIAIKVGFARNYVVEVPRPVFETGVLEVALSSFSDLDARAIIFAGAAPDANRNGSADLLAFGNAQNLFSLANQVLLREMGDKFGIAMMVRAMAQRPDLPPIEEDALLAFDVISGGRETMQSQSLALLEGLEDSGLSIRLGDGSAETSSYATSGIPQSAYLSQTRNKRFAVLWVSQQVRQNTDSESVALQRRQFLALGLNASKGDVAKLLIGKQLASGGLPDPLRVEAERYALSQDIVVLSALQQKYPEFRLERLDDSGGRGAYLLLTDSKGALRGVMSLNSGFAEREISLSPGPIGADDVQQFLAGRLRWMSAL